MNQRDKEYAKRLDGSEVIEGDYRGMPMLIIRLDKTDKFPFQFGLKKARLIVKHYELIKAFAEKPLPESLI